MARRGTVIVLAAVAILGAMALVLLAPEGGPGSPAEDGLGGGGIGTGAVVPGASGGAGGTPDDGGRRAVDAPLRTLAPGPALELDRTTGTAVDDPGGGAGGTPAWTLRPEILSVTAAAVRPGGGWVVLDGRSGTLHLLDGELRVVRSAGGSGDGPGELGRAVAMTVTGDSLVAVLDVTGTRLDLFDPDLGFVDRRTVSLPGCAAGVSQGMAPAPGGGVVVWGVCPAAGAPVWTVAAVEPDGGARVLARETLRRDGRMVMPLGRGVAVVAGVLRILGPDGCLRDPDAVAGTICLDVGPPRPFPEALAEQLLAPPPGRRAGSVPEVALPDVLPPALSTRWSAAGAVLVLPDADGDDGVAAVLRPDGTLVALRSRHPVFPGPDGILVARTALDGTELRSVPWP